jgi:hypothetical protein
MVNCNDDEVKETTASNIRPDSIDMSFSKNVLNAFFPHRFEFEWKHLLGIIYKQNKRVKHYIEQYDFDRKSGFVSLTLEDELLK